VQLFPQPRQTLHLFEHAGEQISKTHLGLLLDRIDIHVELQRLKCDKLSKTHLGESSATARALVKIARHHQYQRITITGSSNPMINSH